MDGQLRRSRRFGNQRMTHRVHARSLGLLADLCQLRLVHIGSDARQLIVDGSRPIGRSRRRGRPFVAQGGDWGGLIAEAMAAQTPPGLLGVHANFPGTVPPDVEMAIQVGSPPPESLSADERRAYEQLQAGAKQRGYASEMGHANKRCPAWLIHPLVSPPGCLTTMRAPRSSSHGPSSRDVPTERSRETM